ncbi:hypothetical protein DRP53_00020 [candidate division WOR-3 bacterium]|uniref:T9SS type A sorting domain-containing protein n=1 Tax=candidate division WOR-3 bacterium TaxID=2052148 RepID=A0A660SLZ1_UNCW3|nr:MAG: hypothetical protein DRP53_00020 [candidate division WOR-3 bacterium]
MSRSGILLIICWITHAQTGQPITIDYTYLINATGYSNGFKVIPAGSFNTDTIYAVYAYTEESLYFAYSYDQGETWQKMYLSATPWNNGRFPSLDHYNRVPYVVCEGDSAGKGEIFLKCPFDPKPPIRISYTPGHSTLPAIIIDKNGKMHIVFQDNTPGNWEIYYCGYDTSPSDTYNLSQNSIATDIYPSISLYNGDEIHVIWERYDPSSYSPYRIVHRYLKDGVWSDEEFIGGPSYRPLHHPSLDYAKGEDDISAAWEDSSSGNLEAYFYRGNGGGYSTPGQSRYPVISTVGKTWSYLYWEDNSGGKDDIFAHRYYFMMGWWDYRFRDYYGDQNVHHPSVSGCYVLWTQGDHPPYQVRFVDEEYPIQTGEEAATHSIHFSPNPFRDQVRITHIPGEIEIYDVNGKRIRTLSRGLWDGRDEDGHEVAPGIYLLRSGGATVKLVKID